MSEPQHEHSSNTELFMQPLAQISSQPDSQTCKSNADETGFFELSSDIKLTFITLMKQQSWLSCHRPQNPEGHRGNQAGTWRGSGDMADPEQRRSLFLLENTCCAHVPCVKVTGRQNNGLCIFMCASSSQKHLFAEDEPGSLMMLSAASRGKELWGTMFPLSRV